MASSKISHFNLPSGGRIPAVGLGTYSFDAPGQVEAAVCEALKIGYRHIDGASIYGNLKEVGAGIMASGVPREEIFVTSKLWNTSHRTEEVPVALDETLADLGLEYLDLYLMHYPCSNDIGPDEAFQPTKVPTAETWAAMEKLVDNGKVRAIGISNFSRDEIGNLLKTCRIHPAVHQYEIHPYLPQEKFLQFHKERNILVVAFTPLGYQLHELPKPPSVKTIEHPKVLGVAARLKKTPAQVLVAWGLTRGYAVIPKSVTKKRLEENFAGAGELLDKKDMKTLNEIDVRVRTDNASEPLGYWLYSDLDECVAPNPFASEK